MVRVYREVAHRSLWLPRGMTSVILWGFSLEGKFTHSSIPWSVRKLIYASKALSPAFPTGLLLSPKSCYCPLFKYPGKTEIFAWVFGIINIIQRPKAKMIRLIFSSFAPSLIKIHPCRPHKRRGKVRKNTQLYLSVQDAVLLWGSKNTICFTWSAFELSCFAS